jgi:hypothetical protein
LQRDDFAISVDHASGEPMTAIVLAVVVSFSLLVTIHVVGSVALTRLRPRWNGAVALLVPPFFPYYAVRRHMSGWAIAWISAAVAYAIALSVAAGWR